MIPLARTKYQLVKIKSTLTNIFGKILLAVIWFFNLIVFVVDAATVGTVFLQLMMMLLFIAAGYTNIILHNRRSVKVEKNWKRKQKKKRLCVLNKCLTTTAFFFFWKSWKLTTILSLFCPLLCLFLLVRFFPFCYHTTLLYPVSSIQRSQFPIEKDSETEKEKS